MKVFIFIKIVLFYQALCVHCLLQEYGGAVYYYTNREAPHLFYLLQDQFTFYLSF
jgi:hypothetical protein